MSQAFANALRRKEWIDADDLQKVSDAANDGHEMTRSLARGLTPVRLDDQGLTAAFRDLADTTTLVASVPCRFDADAHLPDVSKEIQTHLYRIAQEAVNNPAKYARAHTIRIGLHLNDDRLTLTVADDGVGFPSGLDDSTGMGLRSMRYRADLIEASIDIRSIPGRGTEIRCSLDLRS